MSTPLFITRHRDEPGIHLMENYVAKLDGYKSLEIVFSKKPEELVEEIKKSKLRGRGGAGFPTGMKWSFMPKPQLDANGKLKPKYLVCNADEGEPGTFKDRLLLTQFPHLLVEGMIAASWAIQATYGYIYIRGEFMKEARILQQAIDEARAAGYLGKNIMGKGWDFNLCIYRGAGAYICGEETALLNSLEGKRGEPRRKPPFPALVGAFGQPTCVNNVETFCNVPVIFREGWEKFAAIGTEKAGGTRLYCVSGHVNKPGIYELPVNVTLRDLIYTHAGGMKGDKKIKAIIPGGASAPMLSADQIDTPMDFDALAALKTMAGSGGVVIMNEDTCIVEATARLLKFYEAESCGQCSQCREGSHWLARMFYRIESGKGTIEDLEQIGRICSEMAGQTICVFSDAVTGPALSSLQKFRADFEKHIFEGKCPHKTDAERAEYIETHYVECTL